MNNQEPKIYRLCLLILLLALPMTAAASGDGCGQGEEQEEAASTNQETQMESAERDLENLECQEALQNETIEVAPCPAEAERSGEMAQSTHRAE